GFGHHARAADGFGHAHWLPLAVIAPPRFVEIEDDGTVMVTVVDSATVTVIVAAFGFRQAPLLNWLAGRVHLHPAQVCNRHPVTFQAGIDPSHLGDEPAVAHVQGVDNAVTARIGHVVDDRSASD